MIAICTTHTDCSEGITRTDLAKEVGRSVHSTSHRGEGNLSKHRLFQLCKDLCVFFTLHYLLSSLMRPPKGLGQKWSLCEVVVLVKESEGMLIGVPYCMLIK